DRERAVVPQSPHDRARARAGAQHARGIPPVPDRGPRARREDRAGVGPGAAIEHLPAWLDGYFTRRHTCTALPPPPARTSASASSSPVNVTRRSPVVPARLGSVAAEMARPMTPSFSLIV